MPNVRTNRSSGEVVSSSDLNALATAINTVLSGSEFSDAAAARIGAMVAAAGGSYNSTTKQITLPGAAIDNANASDTKTYSSNKIVALVNNLLTSNDFGKAARDQAGGMIAGAGGTYNATAGTITLPSGGGIAAVNDANSTSTTAPMTAAATKSAILASINQVTSSPVLVAAAQGGSTDNRANINAVIDQVNANGGGAFRLGPGLHRLTGPLNPILANAQLVDSPGARITLASGYTGGLRVKITDGATTSGQPTLTSTAQAQFVAGDVGKRVTGIGIPDGTTIASRQSATSVTMSNNATATNTGITVTIGAAIFTLIGKYVAIRTLQIIGGGNVGSEQAPNSAALNPFIGAAIDLGLGASFANVQDIDFLNVNGWCLLAETVSVGGLYGGVFDGLRGNYSAKGIRVAGNAANKDGQVFLDNLDLQVVTQGHVLEFDTINDAQVGKINGCTGGDVATAYGLNIVGNGSSIFVDNYDVGTFPSIPGAGAGVHIGGGTPNNVRVNGGVAQSGSPAVLIDGGFNVRLGNLQVSRGGGAGVRITGGDLITLADMTFARNGYTAGAGQYELEVTTTTGRVRVSRCDFTTPLGTASQQVDYVFKLPAINRVQIDADNRYTGGHLEAGQKYLGGNQPGQAEPGKTGHTAPDYGLAGWTFDPALATGNTVLATAGVRYGGRFFVSEAKTIPGLWGHVVTAGVGLTTGQNFGELFDSAGNLVAQTIDQTSGWGSSGLKQMMFATPVALQPGWYDASFTFNGTTGPAFARAASIAAMNANLTGQAIRFWTANTGLTTPALAPTTLGTKAAQSLAWWIAAG